jgi:hypothetical protein
LTLPELAAIRKTPPACFSARLAPQLLKHSEEQTLASLVAVYQAMADFELTDQDYSQWAVVSSSRYMARSAFAAVIDKYRVDGPWGVSVQVIPHRTPHAVAGTISLALQAHGPCIGMNGGQGGDNSALISLPCLLRNSERPGAWMVFSGWSPELAIDRSGKSISDSTCVAVALALTAGQSAGLRGRIRFDAPDAAQILPHSRERDESPTRLLEFLASDNGDQNVWRGQFGGALQIEVELASAGRSLVRPWRLPFQPGHSDSRYEARISVPRQPGFLRRAS